MYIMDFFDFIVIAFLPLFCGRLDIFFSFLKCHRGFEETDIFQTNGFQHLVQFEPGIKFPMRVFQQGSKQFFTGY